MVSIYGDGDEIAAYTQFITGLCDMAKRCKKSIIKADETDNDKYASDVFCSDLALSEMNIRAARKILLRNLTGNSAFR